MDQPPVTGQDNSRLAKLGLPTPDQPPPVMEQGNSPKYEIIEKQGLKMVKATIANDTVRAESGALHYMKGEVELESKLPGAGGLLKSMVTKENIFRPTYTGTGEVYFGPPIFGEYNTLVLNGDSWVLDRGAYVCSDISVEIGVVRNKLLTGLMGGEGLFQTSVSGHGTVIFQSAGPVEIIELNNETLTVDGSFAVARQSHLDYKMTKAAKGWIASATSGEGLVNVIKGTGQVYIAPVPNVYQNLIDSYPAPMPKK
tara:strand:- start:121 stop:885 length:765 start_codon:yes stop_codon:yes gene_type:complete